MTKYDVAVTTSGATAERFPRLLSQCLVALATFSAAFTTLLVWAILRTSPFIHFSDEPEYDPLFPRPFPYPDRWIVAAETRVASWPPPLPDAPMNVVRDWLTSACAVSLGTTLVTALAAYVLWRRPFGGRVSTRRG